MDRDDATDDFTMQFDKNFQSIAQWLSRGDKFLAKELRSVMHIAILQFDKNQRKARNGMIVRAAKYKAIDYLRSKAHNYSYSNKVKHFSLDSLTCGGFQIDSERNIHVPQTDAGVSMRLEEDYNDEPRDPRPRQTIMMPDKGE